MRLTEKLLREYLQIEGLTFKTEKSLVGTCFCKIEHTIKDAINDVNDWILEYFPNRALDITQGYGYDESDKYYLCVTLDEGGAK